jgi:GNAT superfamily N-acetyltransferase
MQIQIATPTDIEELTQVEIESKLASFRNNEPVAIDYATRLYRWQTYFAGQSPASSKPERVVFKAVADGKIIGFIAGHLTDRYGKDAEIQNFYILKPYQRQGAGTTLLKQLVGWLLANNAESLCVGIAADNPYQEFYLKHGGFYINEHWIGWDHLAALVDPE